MNWVGTLPRYIYIYMPVGTRCFQKAAMYLSVGSACSWCPAQAQAGLSKWLVAFVAGSDTLERQEVSEVSQKS